MIFGKQLIQSVKQDEVIPSVVLFEDGTYSGDADYVERILKRRRAVRDAIGELIILSDDLNRPAC